MIKRKIIYDSILNIFASAIPIIILQIVVLPIIGLHLGDEKYGLAVTLISFATLFSLPFGNVLNNVRLLMDREYNDTPSNGDFNILLLFSVVINAIIMISGTIYYHESAVGVFLVTLFSSFNILREYLLVSFRIRLNYKGILINNIILGIGYIIGLLIFKISGYWQFVYVIGSLVSLVYIINNSKLLSNNFKITKFFKVVSYKSFVLFISTFMKTGLTYADKIILYPLIGPSGVSIYYSATLMGKIISMAITPISSVMLSYLSKMEKLKLKDFFAIIMTISAIGMVGYFIIIFISRPILDLLYPKWADESLKLIHLTTATAIIGVLSSVIHPIILRFNHINWQLFINIFNLIVYTLCSFIFYNLYGLIGFCFGLLLASVIKLLIMIIIFVYSYQKSYV